jgi:nitrilase
MKEHNVRVAVVQSAPILFDKESAFVSIASYAKQAQEQGVRMLVFPEVFISGYPRGLSFGTKVGSRNTAGRKDWLRYWESAIDIPGADTERLAEIAKETGLYLVIGVVERDQEFSGSTLYNAIVYMGPDGELLGKHRKLVPTGAERLLYGQGDGSTLTVIDTPFGRIGGLICWENYMPFARAALYAKGIDILITPTADARDTWQATLQHIACEGRCFVLSSNQFVTKSTYPTDLACYEDIAENSEIICRGGSAIVGPLGEYIKPPLYDQEGMVVADLDMSLVMQSRFDFDVMGHYNRPDVFELIVNEKKLNVVSYQS